MSKEKYDRPAGKLMRRPSALYSPLLKSMNCPSGRTILSLLTQSRVGPYLYVLGPDALHAMFPPIDPLISVGSTG